MNNAINRIPHKLEVIHVGDKLLEIGEHAMLSPGDAAPISAKGLVHQFMTETCHYSSQRMEIVHVVGFLRQISSERTSRWSRTHESNRQEFLEHQHSSARRRQNHLRDHEIGH